MKYKSQHWWAAKARLSSLEDFISSDPLNSDTSTQHISSHTRNILPFPSFCPSVLKTVQFKWRHITNPKTRARFTIEVIRKSVSTRWSSNLGPFLKGIPAPNPKMGLQRKVPNNILSKWIDAAFVTFTKAPKLSGNSHCLIPEQFSCCGDSGRSFTWRVSFF